MKIACYPFAAGADMEENLSHIRTGVKAAAEEGAHLVCFQECALTGYPPVETQIESVTEEKCAAGLRAVSALAREEGVCILMGAVVYDGGRRYNSALVFDAKGEEICRYDKRALWGWDAESFTPGERDGVFTLDGIKIGVRICFDVRFPELFRELFDAKADLCIMPFCDTAEHLPERRRILTGHLRTRAAENVMQLLSVNSLSRCPAVPTAWFDQNGRIRKQINKEGLLLCDVTVPEEDFGMRGRRVNAEKFIAQRNKKP